MFHNYQNKKVTIEDLKENKHIGCKKCKYEKVCGYCGLDWTDISKNDALTALYLHNKETSKINQIEYFEEKIDEIIKDDKEKAKIKEAFISLKKHL